LRWVDLDAQGHVNNTLIADYMQEARVRLFAMSPATKRLTAEGVVVVGHQVEYAAPIDFTPEPLRISVGVEHVGGSVIELNYDLHHGGERVATARSKLCAFSFAENLPRRLGKTARSAMKSIARRTEPLRDVGSFEVGERHHVHPLSVRWSDQDSYGHVNNVRYFDFVAEARIHVTSEADSSATRMSASAEAGQLWLVARQDLTYLRQLSFRPRPYEVWTSVARIGRTSLTLAAEIRDGDSEVFARAVTVLVCADHSGRPSPLPESLVENLAPYTA
jgi:acyl-CoA thioester hydrolase